MKQTFGMVMRMICLRQLLMILDNKKEVTKLEKPVTGWVAWANGKLSRTRRTRHGSSWTAIFPEGKYINKESIYKNGIKNGPEKD